MNKYCREIEVKIVDYSENMLDKTQREIFLAQLYRIVRIAEENLRSLQQQGIFWQIPLKRRI